MRLLLPLLAAAAAWTAELPMPEIPDPVGLGPRLALIEALRAEGAVVPEGAELEALKRQWWERHGGVPGAAEPEPELGAVDDEALARDRMRRMRAELQRRGEHPPEDASEEALAAALRAAKEREAAAAAPVPPPPLDADADAEASAAPAPAAAAATVPAQPGTVPAASTPEAPAQAP